MMSYNGKHESDRGGQCFFRPCSSTTRSRVPANDVGVLALDETLKRLASFDPQQGRMVELRYFPG